MDEKKYFLLTDEILLYSEPYQKKHIRALDMKNKPHPQKIGLTNVQCNFC